MPCGRAVVTVEWRQIAVGTTEPAVAPVSGPRGSSVEIQAAASLRGRREYKL